MQLLLHRQDDTPGALLLQHDAPAALVALAAAAAMVGLAIGDTEEAESEIESSSLVLEIFWNKDTPLTGEGEAESSCPLLLPLWVNDKACGKSTGVNWLLPLLSSFSACSGRINCLAFTQAKCDDGLVNTLCDSDRERGLPASGPFNDDNCCCCCCCCSSCPL